MSSQDPYFDQSSWLHVYLRINSTFQNQNVTAVEKWVWSRTVSRSLISSELYVLCGILVVAPAAALKPCQCHAASGTRAAK